MSQENGVIRIGRKGRIKFEFEDHKPFEVDVVETHDSWHVTDHEYRDENNEIPIEKTLIYHSAELGFVQTIVNNCYQQNNYGDPPVLTHAEAMEFIAKVATEVGKLRDFFEVRLSGQPASPQPTNVRFSQ